MCGIAASFAYAPESPAIDRNELVASLHSMANRGPDGSGIWASPGSRVGLGHCRLSILDLSSNGAQPMANPQGDNVIVFNGEIYNFKALRRELEQKGYCFRSTSDTEVLLHLYAEKGRAMVDSLRGMYALAIWDARKRGLFLARDPYGIKPLYYADDGSCLRVASQVKALLATGAVNTEPEPAGHAGFFLWGNIPEPYTLYRSIRALPAGSYLWVDQDGRKELKAFSSVRETLVNAERASNRNLESERKEMISSALRDSVRHHLVSDVPIGLFLSSGLDSISLLALAAEEGVRIQTVTLGFEEFRGTPNDETVLAAEAARLFGAKHETVWISRQQFDDHYGKILHSMDQPSIDGVNTFFVSYAAAQCSLKVAISGLGGDELFAGYPSFSGIPRIVRTMKSLHRFEFLGSSVRKLAYPLLRQMTSPKYSSILEHGTSWEGAYLLRRALFMPWELPQILDPDFAMEGLKQLRTLENLREGMEGLRSAHAKVCALESSWYMRNQLLRDSDWASMAHSLELRVPLVDVELGRRLAPLISDELPLSKADMLGSLRYPLPSAISKRPKTGFSTPVREWMLENHPSRTSDRGLRGWARVVYQQFCQPTRQNRPEFPGKPCKLKQVSPLAAV
jgi:asparagine synthase (glutamine-hydrolysing)